VASTLLILYFLLQVHWKHDAKKEDELTVKPGDTVTLVDHHQRNSEGNQMVRKII
jgi:hypothetical protein